MLIKETKKGNEKETTTDYLEFILVNVPLMITDLVSFIFSVFPSGSSKRQILTLAARTLAGQFRDRLKACADSLMENAVVM